MANSLTNAGQQYMLAGQDGICRIGTKIKLYDSTSVPLKDGTGFVELTTLNGYTVGGIVVSPYVATPIPAAAPPITSGDWTLSLDSGDIKLLLANKTWTASGGSITGILGAYLTDASDVILCWWERGAAITIASGDSLTLDSLFIKLG
jgi:hypothetical protein